MNLKSRNLLIIVTGGSSLIRGFGIKLKMQKPKNYIIKRIMALIFESIVNLLSLGEFGSVLLLEVSGSTI
jgi:hypothetical protein